MTTLLLALGCQGLLNTDATDPGRDLDTPADADTDTDADSDADEVVTDVMIASTINYATWNAEMTEVIDDIQDVEGVFYDILDGDGEDTYNSAATIGFVDLVAGEYTVNYTFTDGGASYLGQVTKTVSADDPDPTIEAGLVNDISGEFGCYYVGYEDDVESNTITVNPNGIVDTAIDQDVVLVGNHWMGSDFDGIYDVEQGAFRLNYFYGGQVYATLICGG